MLSKKRGLVIATFLALFSFLSVTYLSCKKDVVVDPTSCEGIGAMCKNNSHCYMGKCVCPVGYTGPFCETSITARFAGSWDVTQHCVGSDSASARGKDSTYVLYIRKSPTNTTFLIDNFYGNSSYNNIICSVDSIYTYAFRVDTITPFHMLYNQVRIFPGANGKISGDDSEITIDMTVRHLTPNVNWQLDTLKLDLKRRSN